MLLVGWVFLLPCLRVLWAEGAWVPEPRSGFLLLLFLHDPRVAFLILHQDVLRFTVHKGLRPNSRIMCRFFTTYQPMMN